MSLPLESSTWTPANRRDFLKSSTAAVVGGSLISAISSARLVHAAGSDILKVGLIGCGGRGNGAAVNAMNAEDNVRLVAMADAFPDQLSSSLNALKGEEAIAKQVDVDSEKMFSGLDAYQKVIDCVDVVLLTTPPGFRPLHLRAAVEAGKHVFTEKPMATDAPGCRSVMESVEIAKRKKLAVVAGFCWRYDLPRRAMMKKIHKGAIGDVQSIYGTYLAGRVKPMPPDTDRQANQTDLQWMLRNWYNFCWLSGDGLVEQAVHAVDWLAWAMQDKTPVSCTAVGGRQIPNHSGNIFDHFEVNYLWENGVRGFLAQRQIDGCYNENKLTVLGQKGHAEINGFGPKAVSVTVGEDDWKYQGESPDMYQVEHNELFESIRKGTPINDGDRMVSSTLMAIMGRMAAYTGQQITWEMALNSKEVLVPELKDWDSPIKVPPISSPGITKFV